MLCDPNMVHTAINGVILKGDALLPPERTARCDRGQTDVTATSSDAQMIFADMYVTHPPATAVEITLQHAVAAWELAHMLGLS